MYIIINADNTLNAMVDTVDQVYLDNQCQCINLPDQTRESLLGMIPFEEARWDNQLQKVIHDPDFIVGGMAWRQRKASERIQQFYPLSTQLNLLRSGNRSANKTMGVFIDQCRQWSNDASMAVDVIDRITP